MKRNVPSGEEPLSVDMEKQLAAKKPKKGQGTLIQGEKLTLRPASSPPAPIGRVTAPAGAPPVIAAKPAPDPLKECVKVREKLRGEWVKGDNVRDIKLIGKYLDDVKLHLVKLKYLERTGSEISKEEEAIAREILEFGVMYSIFKSPPDMEMYWSYMSQLKTYYYDYGKSIPASPNKHEILGSYLLFLITQEDLAEFHLEVERILYPIESSEQIMQNVYIKRAIELERALGEGRFSQVHAEVGGLQMESKLWRYFVQNLVACTRLKIAEAIEAAYERLSISGAMHQLQFKNQNELQIFAAEREWKFAEGFYCFNCKTSEDQVIPVQTLIKDFLGYARELEIII